MIRWLLPALALAACTVDQQVPTPAPAPTSTPTPRPDQAASDAFRTASTTFADRFADLTPEQRQAGWVADARALEATMAIEHAYQAGDTANWAALSNDAAAANGAYLDSVQG